MPTRLFSHACISSCLIPPGREAGTDVTVIVVILILAGLLVGLGLPPEQMLQTLAGSTLISVTTVKLWRATPLRSAASGLHNLAYRA
ncbi:hypothetical protein HUT19_00515 [Streptomyces sp. NA02950]|uniref:hypothetical protein n=1 Tax=Streptomyces sp. NA02950 TaxID=2742137 RepID=UPI0015908F4A|nr:hypothetical protein [Streptomyces sp. NA02950]QKV90455.1 hypothetical protein HUT19_00515 [Streptomyces sp. NA02950]